MNLEHTGNVPIASADLLRRINIQTYLDIEIHFIHSHQREGQDMRSEENENKERGCSILPSQPASILLKVKATLSHLEPSHRLLFHEFLHQISKSSVRVHQLGLRTDEVICHFCHTPKECIFVDPWTLVHPVCNLRGKFEHFFLISRDRSYL